MVARSALSDRIPKVLMPSAFTRDYLRLYVLTDAEAIGARDLSDSVSDAITGGATMVQYREKRADRNTMYTNALRLRQLTRDRGVPFIINDYVDLALAVEADGVHVGQADLPPKVARKVSEGRLWIGVSTHSLAQAEVAAKENPTYVAVGPIFPTLSKRDPDPTIGVGGVRNIRRVLGEAMPMVAIGGIDVSTVQEVRDGGADGVSVISAAWADDIVSACRALTS